MLNWKTTKEETVLIMEIVNRASSLQNGIDMMTLDMDITACHLNDVKLRLKDLLDADDFNFMHDVAGISNHINRETGKLENCFVPRYAV